MGSPDSQTPDVNPDMHISMNQIVVGVLIIVSAALIIFPIRQVVILKTETSRLAEREEAIKSVREQCVP